MALLNVSSNIINNDAIHHAPKMQVLSNHSQKNLVESHKDQLPLTNNLHEEKKKTGNKLLKISGIAFYDKSSSSMYQKDADGVNNIRVYLYDNNNSLISSVLTSNESGINGYFEFINVPEGRYKLKISVPYNMKVSNQLLNNYYGSKVNPKDNTITVILSDNDVTDNFIGLRSLL